MSGDGGGGREIILQIPGDSHSFGLCSHCFESAGVLGTLGKDCVRLDQHVPEKSPPAAVARKSAIGYPSVYEK